MRTDDISCFAQERVAAAKIMVVGCGALGNEVLKHLALFGVGHLDIVDFDTVEPRNLSRSVFYRLSDAEEHRYKVDVMAERLHESISVNFRLKKRPNQISKKTIWFIRGHLRPAVFRLWI